ncbi:O-methyltransferase [Microbacterium hominis]|uniref:O-methyltransferase n=1 Tax=Microbacterium TaxID=33882 RepID=UPI00168B8FC5|nr:MULTISPECIES: O-methyltransferase [Microbacterium]QOC25113.1 O-methyltransferase [Microbacterium hominis]QOC29152.1 O-methyltransferase [Microbacterium hominis]QYF98630.1 O-methyltransferase [Microbacterium sp. PAMC21962]
MTELSLAAAHEVDRYLVDTLVDADDSLDAAVQAQRAADMPAIEVAPTGGKLLWLLARLSGARRVLEIGTLGGYSTIWLARGIPDDGRVVTIEAEPRHAEVARRSIDRAGVGERVDIRVGRGADVLPTLEDQAPFDLVFIDADKESNTVYLDWAARLGRPGTLIVVDNVVRAGRVADAEDPSPQVRGVRAGLQMLRDDPRFTATALQTLDAKGWDGIALALVV